MSWIHWRKTENEHLSEFLEDVSIHSWAIVLRNDLFHVVSGYVTFAKPKSKILIIEPKIHPENLPTLPVDGREFVYDVAGFHICEKKNWKVQSFDCVPNSPEKLY